MPATPVKRGLPKVLEELLIGTYHARIDFSTELKNADVSVTLLKNDSTRDALPAILKVLGTIKGNTRGGVCFLYSYRWVDLTARIL